MNYYRNAKNFAIILLIISMIIFFSSCIPNIEKMGEKDNVEGLLKVYAKYEGSEEGVIVPEARKLLIDMGDSAVDELIKAVGHKDSEIAKAAIRILGNMKCVDAIPCIVGALEDINLEIDAISALANIAHVSTAEILYNYRNINKYSMIAQLGLINTNINYVQPVTEGMGVDAIAYTSDSPSPHKVVIADEEDVYNPELIHADCDFKEWNKYLPEEWQPLGYPDTVQLVLCWEDIDDIIVSDHVFHFNARNVTVRRVQQIKHVILKEAATGRVIADEILTGNEPSDKVITVTEDSKDYDVIGSVTPEMLIEWLRPYVES